MRLRLLGASLAVGLVVTGTAAVAVTRSPSLSASGSTGVTGTEASAVFEVGGRTIRQVRYADRKVLRYTFTLHNDGRLGATVTGLEPAEREATLLRLRGLTDTAGHKRFHVGAGDEVQVVLSLLMTDCERLSARASSLVSEIDLRAEGFAGIDHVVKVSLPEEIRTGSAREMFCPRANASSRPPG